MKSETMAVNSHSLLLTSYWGHWCCCLRRRAQKHVSNQTLGFSARPVSGSQPRLEGHSRPPWSRTCAVGCPPAFLGRQRSPWGCSPPRRSRSLPGLVPTRPCAVPIRAARGGEGTRAVSPRQSSRVSPRSDPPLASRPMFPVRTPSGIVLRSWRLEKSSYQLARCVPAGA